jgi:hypothetical protein
MLIFMWIKESGFADYKKKKKIEGTCAHYMHFNPDFEKCSFVLRFENRRRGRS